MIRRAAIGLLLVGVPLACGSESRTFRTGMGGGGGIGEAGTGGGQADDASVSGAPGDVQGGAAGQSGAAGEMGEDGGAGAAGETGGPIRCDPTKPFATPLVVPGVNGPKDYGQRRLSVDGLKMFVWRGTTLLTATRASPEDPFDAPAQDPNLTDAAAFLIQSQELSTPTFSADALTLYAHFGGQGRDLIYTATRLSANAKFAAPAPSGIGVTLPPDPKAYGDDPFISADGTSLYLDSGGDLYVATKTAGKFGAPLALRLVNTIGSNAG